MLNMCMPHNGDIHRLDQNNNGQACEEDPRFQPTSVPPTQPPAASSLRITFVDKQAEFVDIRNDGGAAQDLGGWRLVSERGGETCPLSGSIGAGQTLRVWMLDDDADKPGYHCNSSARGVFSNSDPDPAVLYNAQGQEVSRY